MAISRPFSFQNWIEEHRDVLKPPVGNKKVYYDNDDFIVMVVGGPNSRKDYHWEEGEEFFYQIEGDMTLKIIEDGKPVDIPIKQGEIFLLPPRVPHSPQRPAGTVGLVIERYRKEGENDGFHWYCEDCGTMLYETYFPLADIEKLPEIMKGFYASEELRTCKECGKVMDPPA